jgi:ABC-type antimicrobial peptide transport system permease subunit
VPWEPLPIEMSVPIKRPGRSKRPTRNKRVGKSSGPAPTGRIDHPPARTQPPADTRPPAGGEPAIPSEPSPWAEPASSSQSRAGAPAEQRPTSEPAIGAAWVPSVQSVPTPGDIESDLVRPQTKRANRRAEAQRRKAEQDAERDRARQDARAVLTGTPLPGEEFDGRRRRGRIPVPQVELPDAVRVAWLSQMYEALMAALHSLSNNRLRSFLTTIGIVAGVAAVIVLVAMGNGMRDNFEKQADKLANQITLSPATGAVPDGSVPRHLTDTDVKALLDHQRAPHIQSLSQAVVGSSVVVTAGQAKDSAILVGAVANYLQIIDRHMVAGTWFTEAQIAAGERNVVIGPQTVNLLFGRDTDPATLIGQQIRLSHSNFKIQGVLKTDGSNDNTAIVPLAAARAYLVGNNGGKLDQVVIKSTSVDTVPDAVGEITDILDGRHNIKQPTSRDFSVKTFTEALKENKQYINFLTLFVIAIAAISLFVGGVGVANIMLVSVTERTREIGIRKAVGAPRKAILRQFLSEAVMLTGLGGLVGVIIGVALSQVGAVVLPKYAQDDPNSPVPVPILTWQPVVIAFGVSLLVGLVAGGYPAYRAARMRPIDALRFE